MVNDPFNISSPGGRYIITPRNTEAVKQDEGKLPYELIPPHRLRELVEVIQEGAVKYAPRDWEKGMPYGRMFGAMQRHSWAWWGGESMDTDGGKSHLIKVAFAAIALREWEVNEMGVDDRP